MSFLLGYLVDTYWKKKYYDEIYGNFVMIKSSGESFLLTYLKQGKVINDVNKLIDDLEESLKT